AAYTDKRWREITKSPPTKLGVGSLIYKVRQVEPNWIPPLTTRLQELAAMSGVDYDRVRVKEADKLGIRVSTLDEEVEKFRKPGEDSSRAGRALELPLPEPWSTSVDGAKLLDDLSQAILRFVFMPREAAASVALWIVHAHAFRASMISPRLVITAPEKR